MKKKVLTGLWYLLLGGLLAGGLYAYKRFVLGAPEHAFSLICHGITYELLSPTMLGVALVLPFLLWVTGRSLADLPWPQRALSLLFRFGFIVLIGVGLSRVSKTAHTKKVCTVMMVDVSESVTDAAIKDAEKLVAKALREKGKEDVVRVITFAVRPRRVDMPIDGKTAPVLRRHAAKNSKLGHSLGSGSNLQAALQLAYGLYPPGYLKRAVLISDGLQTNGDVLAEASRAKRLGVLVSTIPYKRPLPGEVAVRSLKLPPKVKVGQAFEIHADIYASRATKAHAKLFQGEALNGLGGVRELDLHAGPNDVVFKSVVRVAGEVTYSLKLSKIGNDTFGANNAVATTVDVPGRPTVLYVEGTPPRASYLSSALSAQQYDVDVRPASAFPGSLKEMERYDFFILSDVHARKFGEDAQTLVESYVRDLGGGFLYAGGENSYSLGGWMHSTVERILPVRMESQKKREMPSVALSLVIDRSGSMSGQPMEMAKAAAKAAVAVLQPNDLVEVIAFDSSATRFVKVMSARRKGKINNNIARIQAGGGTAIFPALDAAYQDLSVTQARKKHTILLTDGNAPSEGIREVVQAMAAEGITVTTVGLGPDVDDALLTMIKDLGGGRYHKVPDAASLPKIFTSETEEVSRQAAQEDWFPVSQVGSANFLAGIDISSAPYLHGYVSTQLKPTPAHLILESDKGEPILARWRVGLGWTLAWTSDIKNRWAVEWLRWPGFGKFFGQLIREHMRVKRRREFDLKTTVIDGRVHAFIDAFSHDERFENGLESKLTISGPMPSKKKQTIPMRQTAPGRYEASFPLDKYGSFLLKAEHSRYSRKGKKKNAVAVSYGHISHPYPKEYSQFEPDRDTLLRLARTTDGHYDPQFKQVFDPGEEKITYHKELWPKAIMAALVLYFFDLLLRRVRFFDRKVLPKGPLPKGRASA